MTTAQERTMLFQEKRRIAREQEAKRVLAEKQRQAQIAKLSAAEKQKLRQQQAQTIKAEMERLKVKQREEGRSKASIKELRARRLSLSLQLREAQRTGKILDLGRVEAIAKAKEQKRAREVKRAPARIAERARLKQAQKISKLDENRAKDILREVAKTGKITREQSKRFQQLGFDERQLTKAAVERIEEKRLEVKKPKVKTDPKINAKKKVVTIDKQTQKQIRENKNKIRVLTKAVGIARKQGDLKKVLSLEAKIRELRGGGASPEAEKFLITRQQQNALLDNIAIASDDQKKFVKGVKNFFTKPISKENAKKIVLSIPKYSYSDNLRRRQFKGEVTPLANDFKNFSNASWDSAKWYGRQAKNFKESAATVPAQRIIFYSGLIKKGSIGLAKLSSRSFKGIVNYSADVVADAQKGNYKKLPDDIKSLTNAVVSGSKKGAKWIKKPENQLLVGVVLSTIIVSQIRNGQKFIKNIPKDPGRGLGAMAGFIVTELGEDYLGGALIRGLDNLGIGLRRLKPTTIKGVKILEGAPSERVTGQFLKSLEGKKVNLFTASEAEVKKLLKGSSPIGKKELDFLIKDMKRNPTAYIDSNFKIKPLKTIATSKDKRIILNALKGRKDVFLSGSGTLKLQLKSFRKVGDLDILAKNPKAVANALARELNNKTILGRMVKNRYRVNHFKGTNTYQVWDSLLSKKFKKNLAIADVVELKPFIEKFGKIKPRVVEGLQLFPVEKQLAVKTIVAQDPNFLARRTKELKDIKLITGKKLTGAKRKAIDKLLPKNGFLKVEARPKGMGSSRRLGWAEEYLGNLNIGFRRDVKKEAKIISRLKKEWGFTDAQIQKNINLYSPSDMYFAPNQIYANYLSSEGKGSILMVKDVQVSSYPKNVQDLIKKNFAGQLGKKEQSKLANLMRLHRTKNPNKVFVGQRAIQDRVGELEILAPEFTKLFPKKTILKREVYIPGLRKFIEVQEVVIGKQPKSKVRDLIRSLKSKFKKGYKVTDMKKDITKWANKKVKGFKKKVDLVTTKKGRAQLKKAKQLEAKRLKAEKEFISKERKALEDLDKRVKDSDLPSKEKIQLRRNLRERIKKLTPSKRGLSPSVRTALRKARVNLRKRIVSKISKRVIKRVPTTRKRVKGTTPTIRRPTPKPRLTPRPIKPKPRLTPRPIKPKPRPTPRPRGGRPTPRRTPKPAETPKKPKRLPDLDFNSKNLKDRVALFIGKYRERQNPRKPFNKRTNKVVVKTLRIKDTKNRALKRVSDLADNKAIRSIDIKLVGITTTKKKDIKSPKNLAKFRTTKSKLKDRLNLVEKAKHTLDKRTERRELASLKKKKPTKKTVKKKITKKKVVKKRRRL